jgi:hypothetical protein
MIIRGKNMIIMRGSLIAILLMAFGLPFDFSVSGLKIAATVSINGQFRLDDAENFDFKHLSVFTQHRLGKYGVSVEDGTFIPDENGRFVVTVPAGSRVFMQVTSADPTIIEPDDAPDNPNNNDGVGFYEMEKGKKHTLLFKDFNVPDDSSSEMELTIQLYRGAAFSVCLPDGMTSGSIQFRPEAGRRRNRMSVLEFSGSETVRESLMGGLSSGRWKVYYVDDNSQILKTQQLDLRRGQIIREKCQ